MLGTRFGDIRRFEDLDSTNRHLVELARSGAPEGIVVVADHQWAGRGRRGRTWEAPPGSCLLLSVLLRPALDADDLHLATAAVALAAVAACSEVSGVDAVVKWPNDLLVGGAKLAGVLAEAVAEPSGSPAVVVGIGINVDWPGPEGAGGTSLSAAGGRSTDRDQLLSALLEALEPRRAALDEAVGRRAVHEELRSRCDTLGRRVRVELIDRVVVGTAVDLTSERPPPGSDGGGDPRGVGRRRGPPTGRGGGGPGRGPVASATMRLLVTGGAGFIGSNFVRYWIEQHPEDHVVAYDVLTYAGNLPNLADVAETTSFVQGDIGDLAAAERTLAAHDIDTVVHFAAESHNSLAILDPGLFFRTNVLGTQTMLEAARRHGVRRFHHISTCEVYGDLALDTDETFSEESPYRPRTPYNASKAGADHAVRAYFETFDLPVTITNCCNNYGPFQFPEKVIPLFTTHALDDQPLPLYASTQNRREWLHVRDHCEAVAAVLDRGVVGETYHVGSGVEASIEEIADLVLSALGKPPSLKEIVPDRPGHDRRYLLDSSKIKATLGWAPTIDFADGMAETVAWYRDNRSWWEPLRNRAPVVEAAWARDR